MKSRLDRENRLDRSIDKLEYEIEQMENRLVIHIIAIVLAFGVLVYIVGGL